VPECGQQAIAKIRVDIVITDPAHHVHGDPELLQVGAAAPASAQMPFETIAPPVI
jgi:hypothetical protein